MNNNNNDSFIRKIMLYKFYILSFIVGILFGFALLIFGGYGQIAKLTNGEEVVATYKDNTITANGLYTKIKDGYARDVLLNQVDNYALNKEYETTDDMIKKADSYIEYYKQYYNQSYLDYIKYYYGVNSTEEFKAYLLMNQKKDTLIKAYVEGIITEKQINDYYKTDIYGDIEAKHILIKPNVTTGMTDDEKKKKEEEALNLAKEIILKINNGEDFSELAKEYSQDSASASNGGVLNKFNKGDMYKEFEDAAYALKEGEYTKEPVKTEVGYHIILVTKKYDKPSLEDSKTKILNNLSDKMIKEDSTYQYKALKQLREKYEFTIKDIELKKQYDEYIDRLIKNNTIDNTK